MKRNVILGISCFYHDSAAALIVDGKVVAAAEEERFSRIKHDSGFPKQAAEFCLAHAGVSATDIEYVVFYEKPLLKFERLLMTYITSWPWGLNSFIKAMSSWLKVKFWIERSIRTELGFRGEILYIEHHYAHAASAYFASPFESAALVVMDGVGEWDTTTIGVGRGTAIELTRTIRFPHSLGLLYSALTYYLGFKVNSAEYKVMGLAPYGDPSVYRAEFSKLIDIKPDGSFALNMEYFAYEYGLTMTNHRFSELFGAPPRQPSHPLSQREKDIAAALQETIERCILGIAKQAQELTGEKNICLAGGVALNCVANGKLLRSGLFERVYIQPAAGDSGGAVGAALYVYFVLSADKKKVGVMPNVFLGPAYSDADIRAAVGKEVESRVMPEHALAEEVARLIDEGNIIGWFQGRMEYGPRALGNRSILGDPRRTNMQKRINAHIKHREDFRPFAPAVLEEYAEAYFDISTPSPYMLFVAKSIEGLPATTHVDGSARVQTVAQGSGPFRTLLEAFYRRTGCPVLLNTSFNVRGEPMVMTPQEAMHCFLETEMDYLVLGTMLIRKPAGYVPPPSPARLATD